ncbi:MAG: DUF3500 domain-containing protein [Candidatus Rokuibacteriota bacterium]
MADSSGLGGPKLRQRPPGSARTLHPRLSPFLAEYRARGEAALGEPFKGITTDGRVMGDLFPLRKTGVPTRPITDAAGAFLASLAPEQRARVSFEVDSDAWRRWSNIHPFIMRHGVCLDEMTPAQRRHALALVETSLSAQGFRTARDVMRLNDLVRVITGNAEEYGEWLYWLSVMGRPAEGEPWGWQLDGHHLIVNCFVLGDQVVLTPLFMGSEPVAADSGPCAGTRVFQAEEEQGLALIRALTPAQRERTVLATELPGEAFTAAFRDNLELRYDGIGFGELSGLQQERLVRLVELYVGRIRAGHDRIKMDEVRRHLGDMHFAWMGGVDEESVFYYRLHSPVVLIEFDHQRGIVFDNDTPSRHHIHTVVRTPNGNDYGRDLLRQHHAQFDHGHGGHGHAQSARP